MSRFPSLRSLLALASLAGGVAAVTPASAAVLVTVDVSNPTVGYTFTATGAAPSVNDSSTTTFNGVTLQGLFASDFFRVNNNLSGTLTAAGATGSPFNVVANNTSDAGLRSLNLFQTGGLAQMTFVTTAPAFTGSSFILSSVFGADAPFAAVGTIGDITVGNGRSSDGSGATLGQFQIVPEPSSLALLGLGGVALLRRRRVG